MNIFVTHTFFTSMARKIEVVNLCLSKIFDSTLTIGEFYIWVQTHIIETEQGTTNAKNAVYFQEILERNIENIDTGEMMYDLNEFIMRLRMLRKRKYNIGFECSETASFDASIDYIGYPHVILSDIILSDISWVRKDVI